MATVAEQYPVQRQGDGRAWYRRHPRRVQGRDGYTTDAMGWTSNPGYADVSYGVGDGHGTAYPIGE